MKKRWWLRLGQHQWDGKNESNLECILELKPFGFTDGLGVGCDLRRESRMIFRFAT